MLVFLSAFILGLMTILDPCTLFTSIAAIGYLDREIADRRQVLLGGSLFVLGKVVCYLLLAIPFMMGAQLDWLQEQLEAWGEPVLAAFMLLCGVVLLVAGRHSHCHTDDWFHRLIRRADKQHAGFWAFVLGLICAVAFCPHRLIYFMTMAEQMMQQPMAVAWIMPLLFGLATGLPILLIAWIISYTTTSVEALRGKMEKIERWFRYGCGGLFLAVGVYMIIHLLLEH